jgi:hypothetical protein
MESEPHHPPREVSFQEVGETSSLDWIYACCNVLPRLGSLVPRIIEMIPNTFLFPVAKRLTEQFFPPHAQPGSDLTLGMGPFNSLLSAVLSSEAPLVARHRLPSV